MERQILRKIKQELKQAEPVLYVDVNLHLDEATKMFFSELRQLLLMPGLNVMSPELTATRNSPEKASRPGQ